MSSPERPGTSSRRDFLEALLLGGATFLAWPAPRGRAQERAITPIVVYAVGSTGSGLFVRSLRDALHGLPVSLSVTRVPSLAEARYLPAAACSLAITLEEGDALVLRLGPDGSQLLRRIPLRRRLDAAARAAIGHVLRTTVEAVLRLQTP
ncbi:MAG: hypothetical protein GXP55_10065 [Deltaproteobacteria bacterium]|nr:hypothetical protein [Deltaproteobacteria bacterium]